MALTSSLVATPSGSIDHTSHRDAKTLYESRRNWTLHAWVARNVTHTPVGSDKLLQVHLDESSLKALHSALSRVNKTVVMGEAKKLQEPGAFPDSHYWPNLTMDYSVAKALYPRNQSATLSGVNEIDYDERYVLEMKKLLKVVTSILGEKNRKYDRPSVQYISSW